MLVLLAVPVLFPTEVRADETDVETGAFGYSEDEGYAIVPLHAGSTVIDEDVSDGRVQLYKAHRRKNQTWQLKKYGDFYIIQNMSSGRVLEAASDDISNGVQVRAAKLTYADQQLWWLDPAGDGTYAIKNKCSSLYCIDSYRLGTANGTALQMYFYQRQKNQRFRFVHMTTIEDRSDWGASYTDCNGSDWDIWNGSSDNSWYYQDTEAKIYYIDSCDKLAGLSQLVRDGVQDFTNRIIVLTRDLNLAGIEWRRIGTSDRAFGGSFNGNGHAIVGLSITTTDSEDGLFGHIDGGGVVNLRVKGSVSGDFNTGGVIGKAVAGHIVNVYSEVTVTRATDDNEGGVVGRLGYNAYIEHCTQNARVNSGDKDPDRGGVIGYCVGVARYCVNKSSVECNWNYFGGIAGECVGGKIEFCANYGQVSGGGDAQWAGGITGCVREDGIVFGCYNEGKVFSDGDDYIGGIAGERKDDGKVFCCINLGTVYGDDRIGGITGDGWCKYCFNVGIVTGDEKVGAVSGSASSLNWCRALALSSGSLHGEDGNKGAEWLTAEEIVEGKACYDIDGGGNLSLDNYGDIYEKGVFCQNIGGDMYPDFTGQKVRRSSGKHSNDEYEVRVTYLKDYGTVKGAGSYSGGKVVLSAEPADGCVFDHFEVSTTYVDSKPVKVGSMSVFDLKRPGVKTETYTEPEITLTDNIESSYDVRAVFKAYDETPEDLKQRVKIELECVDDVDGWNSSTVPVYLVDSAGERHLWEVSKDEIDGDGKTTVHTFDLGTASPVYLEVYPDFGGGITFRGLGMRARMWMNDSGGAYLSNKVTIRSYPFISSKYGNDYMHISFGDFGKASVGILNEDGSLDVKGTYTNGPAAWRAAISLGKDAVIRLNSVWLLSDRLVLSGNSEITLDLNGYPVIRTMKKTKSDGEVIMIDPGSTLHIIDSMPQRKSCSAFLGGSIQGGRSTNGAGILHVRGTLTMKGGAVYNGGTTDVGGGIKVKGGSIDLEGTLIANCWSNKARFYDNNAGGLALTEGGKAYLKDVTIRSCTANERGGAVHMNSDNAELILENVTLAANKSNDEQGGAIYQDGGSIRWIGGKAQSNRALGDDGGAIYQNKGTLYCENVIFDRNDSDNSGGAVYIATDDQTWFVGCDFRNNYADDHGGAVYQRKDHLYLQDTMVTGNGSKGKGGGIYLESNSGSYADMTTEGLAGNASRGSVDLSGKIIIRNNDGKEKLDNLVLENGAYLYDQGLTEGSEIHLCSTLDDTVRLSDPGMTKDQVRLGNTYRINEFQLKYFIPDKGEIKLTNPEDIAPGLIASAFTEGKQGILIGGIIILAAVIIGIIVLKKGKGGKAA